VEETSRSRKSMHDEEWMSSGVNLKVGIFDPAVVRLSSESEGESRRVVEREKAISEALYKEQDRLR
jgi:hypothetical protein